MVSKKTRWWFKYVLFSSLFGEDVQFDEHISQMGWFNHQPENDIPPFPPTTAPVTREGLAQDVIAPTASRGHASGGGRWCFSEGCFGVCQQPVFFLKMLENKLISCGKMLGDDIFIYVVFYVKSVSFNYRYSSSIMWCFSLMYDLFARNLSWAFMATRHWRTMPSTTFLWYVGQVCPKRLERAQGEDDSTC